MVDLINDSTEHEQGTLSIEGFRSQELPREREIAQALLSRSNNQEMYGVQTFEFEEYDARMMVRKETIKLAAQVRLIHM